LCRREVTATITVVPLTWYYWRDLVASLDDNRYLAGLIVVGAWCGIAVDLNEHMVGQPEAPHDHDD